MRSQKLSKLAVRTHTENIVYMLPTMILFAVVVLIPFFQGIPFSFTSWKSIVSAKRPFNGLANYQYLLTSEFFLHSIGITFKYTFWYCLGANVMGLMLALLIKRSTIFNSVARTVMFVPFTCSVTAGAIIWSYVFTDVYTNLTGLVSPLGMPGQIVYGMVVVGIWRDMGYTMLIYLAALQTVSEEYYEAATIDGATEWQRFWKVTVPMIVPAFTTNITLLLAWGLRTFDLPMAVAKNVQEGQFAAVYIYQSIFGNSKAGLGQAAAIILTVILIVLTQIVTRALRKLEVEA